MASLDLYTDDSKYITTDAGDYLDTSERLVYGGGVTSPAAKGATYDNVNVLVVGNNTTVFLQYWRDGVRTKPPMGGGVVSGYQKDVYFLVPWFYEILTEDGNNILDELGRILVTDYYYPSGAAFVTGYGVLGVVATAGKYYGGGLVGTATETVTPVWANNIITSHIGAMDFTHDDTGEVVQFVLPWYNWCYTLKKLGTSGVVAYGENGVSLLTPHGVVWGQRPLLQVGIKGKLAVVSSQDDLEHYMIDEQGFFWHLVEGRQPKRVDFSNYFNAMSENTVMTWDYKDDIVYICDGTYGYTWTKDGLGQGPATISGLGIRWGEDLMAVGPSSIAPTPFNVCTDIIDFGCRTEKIINEVDLGVAATNDLYVALDYRWEIENAFTTSPWVKANRQGRAFFMLSGVEFKVRVKLLTYEDIQLDYANIRVRYEDAKPIGMVAA